MREDTRLVLSGGLFAGLMGYGTVVIFFAVLNLVAGRSPFYTAALFGSALFFGLEDPSQLAVTPAPVLAYNMVHVLGFLVLGLLASWLVGLAERYPVARFFILFVLVFVAGHVYAGLLLFAQPILPGAAWQVAAASLLAALLMGWYLLRLHPLLRRELKTIPMGDEAEADPSAGGPT